MIVEALRQINSSLAEGAYRNFLSPVPSGHFAFPAGRTRVANRDKGVHDILDKTLPVCRKCPPAGNDASAAGAPLRSPRASPKPVLACK
jgi:hypothetical protein